MLNKVSAVFSFPPDFLANEGEERERLILQSKSLTSFLTLFVTELCNCNILICVCVSA
jgi:hypothetical protein